MLGLFDRFVPSFVKPYANLGESIVQAAAKYLEEVKSGEFPVATSRTAAPKSH